MPRGLGIYRRAAGVPRNRQKAIGDPDPIQKIVDLGICAIGLGQHKIERAVRGEPLQPHTLKALGPAV